MGIEGWYFWSGTPDDVDGRRFRAGRRGELRNGREETWSVDEEGEST